MLELPETLTLATQIADTLTGLRVKEVRLPTREHKLCFFTPDPSAFVPRLKGRTITGAAGFGIFAEIRFDENQRVAISDGINLRRIKEDKIPDSYQLCLVLEDGSSLVFTVGMYGSITLHADNNENIYYLTSRKAPSVFAGDFRDHFLAVLAESKTSLSTKAFLATEQRFPGIGNGVLQDILFEAGIHPKRKISSLGDDERDRLIVAIPSVLREMIRLGGRDTERMLFGQPGGYVTKLSKNTISLPCPRCGGTIVKDSYLGGAIYACPTCQPL